MWRRAFVRLLSLSFTAFFVVSLLWQSGRQEERRAQAAPAGPKSDDKRDEPSNETR